MSATSKASRSPSLLFTKFALAALVCCSAASFAAVTQAKTWSTWQQHAKLPHEKIWIKQDFEIAKQKAAKENKPLFVFWSVSWCPYCAELKNQVFANPEFPKLMNNFIPVALDGDEEAAQALGETLQISAYPTTLILAPDGKELFRITETITFSELKDVLNRVNRDTYSLPERLQRALGGHAKPEDWKVFAAASWDLVPEQVLSSEENLKQRAALLAKFPQDAAAEKSLFASTLLISMAEGDADAVKALCAAQPTLFADVLGEVLAPGNVQKKRVALAHTVDETWSFVRQNITAEAVVDVQKKWLAHLDALESEKKTPHETRVFLPFAKLLVATPEGKLENAPQKAKDAVTKSIHAAYKTARNVFEKHTLLMDASYVLRQLGAYDDARKLLLAGVKKSETPWYLYSSLANLEKAAGQPAKALEYAKAARESAKGPATRIQWIVSDLMLQIKLKDAAKPGELPQVLREYYQTAFALPDGFATRNAARAKALAKEIKAIKDDHTVKPVITEYDKVCKQRVAAGDKGCLTHFSLLEEAPAKPVN